MHRYITTTEARYYLQSSSDSALYSYYQLDGDGVVQGVTSPQSTDYAVTGGEDPGDQYQLIRRMSRVKEKQVDLGMEVSLRFNWTTHFYSEILCVVEENRRPDQLEDEQRTVSAGMNLYASF